MFITAGATNDETSPTIIQNTSSDGHGLLGYGAGSGIGVYGQGATGNGVQGYAGDKNASGVFGVNVAGGKGVFGASDADHGIGVWAEANGVGGRGLHATGALTAIEAVSPFIGVDAGGFGVGGIGVQASGTKNGVLAQCGTATGIAIEGFGQNNATGVLASSQTGRALDVRGTASFSRSGIVTIPATQKSATVTGVVLSAASLVLATAQQNLTTVSVQAAVPNVSAHSFTIELSSAVPSGASLTVGWFVIN